MIFGIGPDPAERSSVMTEKMLLDSTINRPLMRAIRSSVVERSQIDSRS